MKIIRLFFSMPVMIFLSVLYTIAIGTATFIEDLHGTETARALIYNARWLEVLYLFLGINLIGNIFRFRLWKKNKLAIGLFHTAFILILLGAAVTRYMGYSGTLHFREGESTNQLLTDKSFIEIKTTSSNNSGTISFPLMLSAITPNPWQKSIKTDSEPIKIQLKKYFSKAMPSVIEDSHGGLVITLTVSEGNQPIPLILRPGEQEEIGHAKFSFASEALTSKADIIFTFENNQLLVQSTKDMGVISMRQKKHFVLSANETMPLEPGLLLRKDNIQFALQSFTRHGRITAKAIEESSDDIELYSAIIVDVSQGSQSHEVTLFGGTGLTGSPETLIFSGTEVTLTYGSILSILPFQLRLNDFIIERYPGSRMPSTYESQITIFDSEFGIQRPYRIYMNHILKYRGYRFYQASYDKDELGSILSVSQDPGTPLTYAGYAFLIICLIVNFFNPKSRFWEIGRQLRSPACLLFGFFLLSSNLFAQNQFDTNISINADHANQFGNLIVQDGRGRMKPVNSLAHELLRNLDHPENALNLSPNQWILLMFAQSDSIQNIPLIPINHSEINHQLGFSSNLKFAPPSVFYNPNGNYVLGDWTKQAEMIPKNSRSEFEKKILKIHECLNIIQLLQQGESFRLFPLSDKSSRWGSDGNVKLDRSIQNQITGYKNAVQSNQWHEAEILLQKIKEYQKQYGYTLLPSPFRRNVEIFYNHAKLFQRISPLLLWAGALLFVYLILILIKPKVDIKAAGQILIIILITGFGLQTLGLVLRWIASGHAPWTNKYESMIYIAWAIMFSGVIFSRSNRFTLSLAALLSAGILQAAHASWTDPSITNLMPVLKSHWLITHVSIITASYGFFGLSATLGMLTLGLICLRKKNEPLKQHIQQIAWINERAMLIGLTLVTIGNLLGAVWANESWGRYWGWDPKEAWTLIVILIYTIILHLRLISKISYVLSISIGSTLAFWAVLMTYIGVNFYLSGIHSYAAGEAPPIPVAIYIIIGIQLAMIIWAAIKNRDSS
ncbi:cytochrome c biogenesis protein CcsA [bacterium]